MVDDFIHTVDKGEESERLAADPAHERAFTTFSPNARTMIWFDAARMMQILPAQDTPELLLEMGISRRTFALEGEHRLTYAAALVLDHEDGTSSFEGKARNGDRLLATMAARSASGLAVALETIVERTRAAIFAPLWCRSSHEGCGSRNGPYKIRSFPDCLRGPLTAM